MTTRTAALRAVLAPHLSLFAADHRAALEELLVLAEVGERAQAILSAFNVNAEPLTAAPKKPAAPPRPKRSTMNRPKAKPSRTVAKGVATPTSSGAPGPIVSRPRREDAGPTLRDTILRVLSDANKPLALAEIEAAVKATGYTSSSSAFSKLLAHTVTMMKEDLRRVGRGVYGLA